MNSIATKPRQIFVPDPVLGWRLSANRQIQVGFRENVCQTTDDRGWRTVVPKMPDQAPAIGFYGCSFTYGTSLEDSETFTSRLQAEFSQIRILNRGIGGHGTVQTFLNFRRDVLAGRIQAAVFGVIGDHKYRNSPHPYRMRAFLSREWYEAGIEHVPCAKLAPGGGIEIHSVPIWQPILTRPGLGPFLPDEMMLNMLTVGVLNAVGAFAKTREIPIKIVLLDDLDEDFNADISAGCVQVNDISTPHDAKHRFLPHDMHPNVRANQLYADRLVPAVADLIDQAAGQS